MVMPTQAKIAVSFILVAFSLMMEGTPDANTGFKLPDPIKAGVVGKLYRLDCGRSLANDESVWTPGENVGRSIEFSDDHSRACARRVERDPPTQCTGVCLRTGGLRCDAAEGWTTGNTDTRTDLL